MVKRSMDQHNRLSLRRKLHNTFSAVHRRIAGFGGFEGLALGTNSGQKEKRQQPAYGGRWPIFWIGFMEQYF